MIVSLFKSIVNPEDIRNPAHVELGNVLNAIKSGRWKSVVDEVRSKHSKQERDEVKKRLPAVLFAGKFSERRIDAFMEPSGFVVIDFDGLTPDGINNIKSILGSKDWVYCYFTSPSNKGVKALVKANFTTYEEYKSVFCAIDSETGQLESFDMQNSDISRACFVSHDADMYINENATVFDGFVENWEAYLKNRRLSSPDKIFDMLLKWMDNNGYSYVKGERNHYLYVLASAMCRYGVNEPETEGFFIQKFTDMDVREIQQVISSAYKRNDFGCVRVTDMHPSQEAQYYKSLDVPDFDFDPRMVMVDNIDINNKVLDIAHRTTNFKSFGIPELDRYLVLKSKEMYAIVAGGKTGKTLLMSYLVLLAIKNSGWRFLILTTESEIEEFKSTMVSFICNKHIFKCTDSDIVRALDVIDANVDFIENDLDHLQIFDVYHYQKTKGINYDCIVVDPITNIKKSKKLKGSGNEYFEALYVEYLKFSRQHCSTWVISHTVSSTERERNAPYVQDAEYGVHLYRRCHYGIALYRNIYDEMEKNIVECHVRAVRTSLNRGGSPTTDNNPVKFIFYSDTKRFGYDVIVDGKKIINPLIEDRRYEVEEQQFNYYEPVTEQVEDDIFDGQDEPPF